MAIPIRKKIQRQVAILVDKIFGYDFLKTIDPEELGLDPNKFSRCSPSGNNYLRNLLNNLEISNNDSILDIGCGKGSVLNILINYPFKEICGIEISSKLAKICKKNMLKKKDNRVKIINKDARNFNHFKKYNYYYMYNPCSASILKPIIQNIANQAPVNTKIIYNNPKFEKILLENGFLEIAKFDDEWGNGIKIFQFSKKI